MPANCAVPTAIPDQLPPRILRGHCGPAAYSSHRVSPFSCFTKDDAIYTGIAILHRQRDSRLNIHSAVLGVLIFAIFLTPVMYNAGSDTRHPHTIFQGVIDLAAGHPHRHSETHERHPIATSNLFSPLPLLIASADGDAINQPVEPDLPLQPGMSMPLCATASVHQLQSLLVALLAAMAIGRLWDSVSRLFAIALGVATPPPQTGV